MSDKHTDALDIEKLEALARAANDLPCTLQPFISNTCQVVIHASPTTQSELRPIADFYDAFSPATVLMLIAKIRATEGQAQTSAAVLADANRFQALKKSAFNKTVNGFDGKVLTWTLTLPADEHGDGTLEEATDQLHAYHGCKPFYDAAQLADSTAPGAPVGQERADFEHWYVTHIDGAEIGSTDCAARWSTWLARSGGFYKAPSDWKIAPMPWNAPAAPTAQQSLTAGGAVPELSDAYLLDAFHRHGFFPENLTGQAKFYSAIREIVGKIAAAPLPQVQSEALDAGKDGV